MAGACIHFDRETPCRSNIVVWRGAVDKIAQVSSKAPSRIHYLPSRKSAEVKISQVVGGTPGGICQEINMITRLRHARVRRKTDYGV